VKKTLLWLASLVFLASLVPTNLWADDPPDPCDPVNGCSKPGIGLVAALNQ
jgi:hypothetical protein